MYFRKKTTTQKLEQDMFCGMNWTLSMSEPENRENHDLRVFTCTIVHRAVTANISYISKKRYGTQ